MKTTKLFGLVLVLSMTLLFIQYRFRRPPISKMAPVMQQVQRQTEMLMAGRRDPHRIFCPPPPASSEEEGSDLLDQQDDIHSSKSLNLTPKVLSGFDKDKKFVEKEEVRNVIFITGHRAGGSAVQNVLLRFAMTRNLNVLLPMDNVNYINETHAYINKSRIVPSPGEQKYNILCHQSVFNQDVLSGLFPESTFHIGILRHPLNQSASAFYFYSRRQKDTGGQDKHNVKYSLASKDNQKDPYQAFVNSPAIYDTDTPNYSFTNNRQSIDLGFPVTDSFEVDKHDNSKISKFVGGVDRYFRFIIIAEFFDESLILLRRLLHWKMEDIVYTKVGVSMSSEHIPDAEWLSENNGTEHRKWNSIDYALYGHFKSKLEGMILAQGEGFQQELQKFREIQHKVRTFCSTIKSSFRSLQLHIKPTRWYSGFCLTPSFCDMVSKGGSQLTELIRKHQLENLKILSSV